MRTSPDRRDAEGHAGARRPGARRLAVWLAAALALLALPAAGAAPDAAGENDALRARVDARARAVRDPVVTWRRDFHRHPELSNREFRTAERVAQELASRGLAVRTGVAHTGVVGVLEGGRPGPTVALRADMDALPVTEEVDVPFASTVRTQYAGREVGVMHACGHDAHTAILLGVADVLASVRDELPGRVLFLFQPAEEGAPPGERGGAALMLEEDALGEPRPVAIFGLHVVPQHPTGTIGWRAGGAMASSDRLNVVVVGSQTHAAYPWLGVDPVTAAAHVVLALQAIPARRVDTRIPAVVSIGSIHGGVRGNIIPDRVELAGTVRSLDPEQRRALHDEVRRTAEAAARVDGARAEVRIDEGYPVTWNDPALVRRRLPTLERVAGPDGLVEALPRTGAEDFAFFARQVPGFYFWLGIRPPGVAPDDAAPNHSPHFFVDEDALPLGVRALAALALDTLLEGGGPDGAGRGSAGDGSGTGPAER